MSNRILTGWILLLAAILGLAIQHVLGQAPTSKGSTSGDKAPPGTYTGKLLSLPGDDGAFSLEITSKQLEPKPNAQALLQATAKFQQDYQHGLNSIKQDLATGKNTANNQKRLQDHLARYQQNLPAYQPGGSHYPYQVKKVTQSMDFHADPEVKVRIAELPPEFDEKGKLKKHTAAELKKLKGKDSRLPGYEGKKEDLNSGAIVSVTLSRPRPLTKKEKAEKKDDEAKAPQNVVKVILILKNDGDTSDSDKKSKSNK